MHVDKIWASEANSKVSFIDLKVVASRIYMYGVTALYFKCLGLAY